MKLRLHDGRTAPVSTAFFRTKYHMENLSINFPKKMHKEKK